MTLSSANFRVEISELTDHILQLRKSLTFRTASFSHRIHQCNTPVWDFRTPSQEMFLDPEQDVPKELRCRSTQRPIRKRIKLSLELEGIIL